MCEHLQHFRYQRTQVLGPVARRNQNDNSTPVHRYDRRFCWYRRFWSTVMKTSHAVLQTTVTRLSHCDDFVAGEITPETLWHAFVEIETHVVLERLCLTVTLRGVLTTRVLYDLLFRRME